MKTWLLVLGIPLLLVFAFIVYIGWPWIVIFIGLQLNSNPLRPEIEYAKFPFRLEYEINGERKVIEDTLIYKYDGIGTNEGVSKFIKWKRKNYIIKSYQA